MSTKGNPHGIVVSQRLWCVPHRGQPTWATVSSIGRKYATLIHDGYRSEWTKIRLSNLRLLKYPGGSSYLSKEKYDEEQERSRLWSVFCRAVDRQNGRRDAPDADSIRSAAKLLGIDLTGE